MKIDWKRKLTSRKFWCAVVGFVTPLLITFGVDSNQATQIASIIMSGATLIAYIVFTKKKPNNWCIMMA